VIEKEEKNKIKQLYNTKQRNDGRARAFFADVFIFYFFIQGI